MNKPVYTETENGITYNLYVEQDLEPVRGNLIDSGDEALDRAAEDEVLARLDAGDDWAWALVTVEATAGGCSGRVGLGGCSYADEADFRKGGYWDDLKDEAKDTLLAALALASEVYQLLAA